MAQFFFYLYQIIELEKLNVMKEQEKKRRRIVVKKTKSPELVRSVKAGMSAGVVASAAMATTALMQFQDLWK
jgi:hypothetical protein